MKQYTVRDLQQYWDKPTSKPVKITQLVCAVLATVGVRTLQRAARVHRLAPELMPQIVAGTLRLHDAEQMAVKK
jgi:hypothetical protein